MLNVFKQSRFVYITPQLLPRVAVAPTHQLTASLVCVFYGCYSCERRLKHKTAMPTQNTASQTELGAIMRYTNAGRVEWVIDLFRP